MHHFVINLIKITAHQMQDFQLDNCTRKRLAAGLRPDPLGELKHSPRPPSRKTGAYFYGEGKGGGREERGKGGEGGGGEGREGPQGLGDTPPFPNPENTLALS